MKKKIFLVSLMAVALVCILAISVFAEDIIVSKTESEEYGTVIQLSADPGLDNASQYVSTLKKISDNGTDTESLCILTDGNADNPSYYVFPSSYIVYEIAGGKFEVYAGTDTAPGLTQAMAEFNSAMGTDYYDDYAIVGSWGGRRLNEIVRFEFTSDVTWIDRDHCCMKEYPNLVEVRFDYAVSLYRARSLFYNCQKLTTVIGFEKATDVTDTNMFQGCKVLETIKLPTSISRIPNYMFAGCRKLVIENLSELTSLTTIGKGAFQDSVTLVFTLPDSVTTIEQSAFQSAFKENGCSLTIKPTSQLTTIGDDGFRDCRVLPSIYIPSTVTSIGTNAFRQTYNLKSVVNFENCQITELGVDTFSYSAIESIKLPKTLITLGAAFYDTSKLALVYLPDSLTSIADTFTGNQPANAVYIYTGKDASVLSTCARIAAANKVSANEYDEEKTYTGVNLVVGYSACLAYNNGVHGTIVVDSVDVISYMQPITVNNKCAICNYNTDESTIFPLFTCLGYSAPEDGRGGIAIGFTVNNEAIAEYEEATGKSITFGVYAVAQQKLGENDIFDENGNATAGVINADLTSYVFDAFEIKIVGFAENQKDIKLSLGAYVTEDGKTYSYLQSDKSGELVGSYYAVTYNSVIASLVANEVE